MPELLICITFIGFIFMILTILAIHCETHPESRVAKTINLLKKLL